MSIGVEEILVVLCMLLHLFPCRQGFWNDGEGNGCAGDLHEEHMYLCMLAYVHFEAVSERRGRCWLVEETALVQLVDKSLQPPYHRT